MKFVWLRYFATSIFSPFFFGYIFVRFVALVSAVFFLLLYPFFLHSHFYSFWFSIGFRSFFIVIDAIATNGLHIRVNWFERSMKPHQMKKICCFWPIIVIQFVYCNTQRMWFSPRKQMLQLHKTEETPRKNSYFAFWIREQQNIELQNELIINLHITLPLWFVV